MAVIITKRYCTYFILWMFYYAAVQYRLLYPSWLSVSLSVCPYAN